VIITSKKIDILVLVFLLLSTTFLSLALKFNFLLNSVFFLITPSIYLSLRSKNIVLRNLIFTIPFAVVTGIVGDYILLWEKAWYVPTVFSFRILGVTMEELIWSTASIYFCIAVYEHFQDNVKHKMVDKHLKTFNLMLGFLALIFVVSLILNPRILHISFFYFKAELILILFCLYILLRYPRLLFHLTKVSLYILIVSLIFLLVGVKLGNWIYTGTQFIGWAKIFDLVIPYEEVILAFIFWIFSVEFFEYFDDRVHLLKS